MLKQLSEMAASTTCTAALLASDWYILGQRVRMLADTQLFRGYPICRTTGNNNGHGLQHGCMHDKRMQAKPASLCMHIMILSPSGPRPLA